MLFVHFAHFFSLKKTFADMLFAQWIPYPMYQYTYISIDVQAGDGVVVLCVWWSDIRRFDSFPRHGIVGSTMYGNGRTDNQTKTYTSITSSLPLRSTMFSVLCVSDSFSVCYRHLVFRLFRKRSEKYCKNHKKKLNGTK